MFKYGLDFSRDLVYVGQTAQPPHVFCFYCAGELVVQKGQMMMDAHYVHREDDCRAASRAPVSLPLFDTFDLKLTPEEQELLKWYLFAGNFNQPALAGDQGVRLREQLVVKGMLDYRDGTYHPTPLGLIPSGDLPVPAFVREQDRLIRQQYACLQQAVQEAGAGEAARLAVADLNLYRAQWQRALAVTLYFLAIQPQDGQLYKLGVTDQAVEAHVASLERSLEVLMGPVQVNRLHTLAAQGAMEQYVLHRCRQQDEFMQIAGCLILDFPAGIISELGELGDRQLDELETEILKGRWIQRPGGEVTVLVPGTARRDAYRREVRLKKYRFACKQCGRLVTRWRYPGRPPSLCSDECQRAYARERDRAKTRERVRRYRARQQAAEEDS